MKAKLKNFSKQTMSDDQLRAIKGGNGDVLPPQDSDYIGSSDIVDG